MPVIDGLAEEFEGRARFVKVELDRAGKVLESFEETGIPAYIVFRDGVEVDRLTLGFVDWFLESRLRGMVESGLDPAS